MTLPLDGITVLDLTHVLAGPFCTMTLSDLGATVIKVERPVTGDDTRAFPPFKDGKSAYFAAINHGKSSIALDLKNEEDCKIFDKLLARADVLVENFRPGVMERLGYGWDTLHTVFPHLIYGAVSGFGHTGPDAKRPAYDMAQLLARNMVVDLRKLELLDLAGRGLGQGQRPSSNTTFLGVLNPASRCAQRRSALPRSTLWPRASVRRRRRAPRPISHPAWRPRRRAAPRVVTHQAALHLHRRDVLATRDDDVLGPVRDLQIAVGCITAMSPEWKYPPAEGLGGRLGVLQVALHHRIAADHDLALVAPSIGTSGHRLVRDA
jgi:hypothetical protein